jgi:hypothetical protein
MVDDDMNYPLIFFIKFLILFFIWIFSVGARDIFPLIGVSDLSESNLSVRLLDYEIQH